VSGTEASARRGSGGGGAGAQRVRAEILESERLPGEQHRLLLKAPRIAENARCGQFVHVWCHSPDELDRPPSAALLRRPYSISRLRPPDGIEILMRVRGNGGRILAGRSEGQELDIIGPLGNGFHVRESLRRAVVVAGGIGLAPVPFLLQTLTSRTVRVVLLVGATCDETIPYRVERSGTEGATLPELAALGGEVVFASEAVEGKLVTDLLEERLGELGSEGDEIMAIGPRAMLKRVAEMAGGRLPVQVSLEERMACGVGACRSCVVPSTDGAYKTVCRDGPVFYASEIDWERLDP
jgi:dihydroorotate dehydrogenase electron transfer subunit